MVDHNEGCSSGHGWEAKIILADMHDIIASFEVLQIMHMKRSANQEAHTLAQHAINT